MQPNEGSGWQQGGWLGSASDLMQQLKGLITFLPAFVHFFFHLNRQAFESPKDIGKGCLSSHSKHKKHSKLYIKGSLLSGRTVGNMDKGKGNICFINNMMSFAIFLI